VDANIDDPIFAREIVSAFEEVMSLKQAREGRE
jgi:hypothetical protein